MFLRSLSTATSVSAESYIYFFSDRGVKISLPRHVFKERYSVMHMRGESRVTLFADTNLGGFFSLDIARAHESEMTK